MIGQPVLEFPVRCVCKSEVAHSALSARLGSQRSSFLTHLKFLPYIPKFSTGVLHAHNALCGKLVTNHLTHANHFPKITTMKTQTAITVERVPAKLSAFNGRKHLFYDVELDLMIRDFWQIGGGLVAVEIASISLVDGSGVPDGGPYRLKYMCQGKLFEHAAMRVQHGKLII